MVMWAFSFPIAEVMIETWGTVGLVLIRQAIAAFTLCLFWFWLDGWAPIRHACEPSAWWKGLSVVARRALRPGDEITLDGGYLAF